MAAFRIEDVLGAFRVLEANEDAIPILGDADAMKVLAAWSKTDQRWAKPRGKMPPITSRNHAAVWEWLLSGWAIDYTLIARASGLSPRIVHEKVTMLAENRLIYPDGSMAKAARMALNVHVAKLLGIKQTPRRQAAKRTPDPDTDDNAN